MQFRAGIFVTAFENIAKTFRKVKNWTRYVLFLAHGKHTEVDNPSKLPYISMARWLCH